MLNRQRVAHSGAVCPGLIEALQPNYMLFQRMSSIPGQSAPASLKQAHEMLSDAIEMTTHSGAVCPGLIEARTPEKPLRKEHCIPGQSAPASLKPSQGDFDSKLNPCIPGQSAPASLKHRNFVRYRRFDRAFRGSLPRPH